MLKTIFKLPVLLAIVIGCAVFFGSLLPVSIQQFFYSFSLSIKAVLLFFLPFIIFSLLFSSVVNMSSCILSLILLLVPALCLSNFITTFISYFASQYILHGVTINTAIIATSDTLQPLWELNLPKIVPNEIAMLSAFVLGLYFVIKTNNCDNIDERHIGLKMAKVLGQIAAIILRKGFMPIIPLFILGFLLKLQYDGILLLLIKNYAIIFLAIFIIQVIYVLFLYGLGNNFCLQTWLQSIKNMLPAGITGFTAMSSAAALPLTLAATEENINSKQITRLVIPTTVNIHLIGDCIAIPMLALAIMNSFSLDLPDFNTYLVFACFFVLAKFAVAAVPGGGILVMIPILEKYLGFDSAMVSLITALYIMFDSVITSMNVMGNGAFAMIFKVIFNKVIK